MRLSLSAEVIWVCIGLFGQLFFFLRFFVQWIVSEKQRKSTIPLVFWYFSIAGAVILLSYSIYRKDPVFILGQSMGLLIYVRNLMLIRNEKQA
jgi:lipid-A-disaccharide synthase-like uncharacterized protein